MAEFGSKEFYDAIPKKRMAAGVLLFNMTGQLLLVRTRDRSNWTLPGGVIETDETSRAAAVREIEEELGITISNVRLVGVHHTSAKPSKSEAVIFVFASDPLSDDTIASIVPQQEEIAEFESIDPDHAAERGNSDLRARLGPCLLAARNGTTAYLDS